MGASKVNSGGAKGKKQPDPLPVGCPACARAGGGWDYFVLDPGGGMRRCLCARGQALKARDRELRDNQARTASARPVEQRPLDVFKPMIPERERKDWE